MNRSLDAVPGGVISLTGDMHIAAANHGMAELVGRPIDELVGASVDLLLSAPSRILFQTHVYPALKAGGRVEEVLMTLTTGVGETVPVLFNAVRSATGDGSTYDGLFVRINARSRWEADLLAATRALEQERAASQRLADKLATTARELEARYDQQERDREFRDAFIGVVSHELRTPITTIYGMSHLLGARHATLEAEVVGQYLGDIEAEADRLRRLTEDLLVLSRAEGGRLVVSRDPLVLGHVVRAAVESERARATGHRLEVAAPPGVPLVLGEELYVEQVVRNYLSNAAKYSPPGTAVHVSVVEEDGGVSVRVVDEGPGLPDGPPEQLFELFYRAPGAIGRTGGAGIGLFVCRALVEAMDGRAWAAPAQHGAEFGFWLPAAAGDADEG